MSKNSAGIVLLLVVLGASNSPATAIEEEQLIVFVQPGASRVDAVFQGEQLPAVRAIAAELGVPLHLVDARLGAPQEVAITPLIVYQNHRGRSIYQGRTTTPTRIRNFIRTARYVPQGQVLDRREAIPIRAIGRARLWAPLKVSAVTGARPPDYAPDRFIAESLKQIAAGFRELQIAPSARLQRADRGFYMDFYPWLAEDGTLFLSLALYSQFHCKEPIFEQKKEPLTGPWQDRGKLFQQAARLLEEAVERQIQAADSGDAFDPLDAAVPQVSWEALGFPLPPPPAVEAARSGGDAQLVREWVLTDPGPDAPPLIQFRFPAPLDQYSGEVLGARGELVLGAELKADGAAGFVEVDTTAAVTMGEPMLDEAIRGSLMLASAKYGRAGFEISSVSSDGAPIGFGRLTPAEFTGIFTLKGKSVPLKTVAELEPVIAEDGGVRLLARSAFEIDLRTFNIEGADGPAPARHILMLDVNLVLRPRPAG